MPADETAQAPPWSKAAMVAVGVACAAGIAFRTYTRSELWLDEALTVHLSDGAAGRFARCAPSRRRPSALLRAAPCLDGARRHRQPVAVRLAVGGLRRRDASRSSTGPVGAWAGRPSGSARSSCWRRRRSPSATPPRRGCTRSSCCSSPPAGWSSPTPSTGRRCRLARRRRRRQRALLLTHYWAIYLLACTGAALVLARGAGSSIGKRSLRVLAAMAVGASCCSVRGSRLPLPAGAHGHALGHGARSGRGRVHHARRPRRWAVRRGPGARRPPRRAVAAGAVRSGGRRRRIELDLATRPGAPGRGVGRGEHVAARRRRRHGDVQRLRQPVHLGRLPARPPRRRLRAPIASPTAASSPVCSPSLRARRRRRRPQRRVPAHVRRRGGRADRSTTAGGPATSSPTAPTSSDPTSPASCRRAYDRADVPRPSATRASSTGSTTATGWRPPIRWRSATSSSERSSGRTIWYVWMSGYRTLDKKCERINDTLGNARPQNRQLMDPDTTVFERHVLWVASCGARVVTITVRSKPPPREGDGPAAAGRRRLSAGTSTRKGGRHGRSTLATSPGVVELRGGALRRLRRPRPDPLPGQNLGAEDPSGRPPSGLVGWDASWYLRIIESGYPTCPGSRCASSRCCRSWPRCWRLCLGPACRCCSW